MFRSEQAATMKLNSLWLNPVWSRGEKYVLYHAAHVSIRFVAVTWFDLPSVPETADDASEAQELPPTQELV